MTESQWMKMSGVGHGSSLFDGKSLMILLVRGIDGGIIREKT
jgi:hypothetical protein